MPYNCWRARQGNGRQARSPQVPAQPSCQLSSPVLHHVVKEVGVKGQPNLLCRCETRGGRETIVSGRQTGQQSKACALHHAKNMRPVQRGLACADAAGCCGLGGDVHAAPVVGVPHLQAVQVTPMGWAAQQQEAAGRSAAGVSAAVEASSPLQKYKTPNPPPATLPIHPTHPQPPTATPPPPTPTAQTRLVDLALPHQLPELGVGHVPQLVGAPAGAGQGRHGMRHRGACSGGGSLWFDSVPSQTPLALPAQPPAAQPSASGSGHPPTRL